MHFGSHAQVFSTAVGEVLLVWSRSYNQPCQNDISWMTRAQQNSILTMSSTLDLHRPQHIMSLFPVALLSSVVELVATLNFEIRPIRDELDDVVHIIPLPQFETGTVHLTGARNIYFIRYVLQNHGNNVIVFVALFTFPTVAHHQSAFICLML